MFKGGNIYNIPAAILRPWVRHCNLYYMVEGVNGLATTRTTRGTATPVEYVGPEQSFSMIHGMMQLHPAAAEGHAAVVPPNDMSANLAG